MKALQFQLRLVGTFVVIATAANIASAQQASTQQRTAAGCVAVDANKTVLGPVIGTVAPLAPGHRGAPA